MMLSERRSLPAGKDQGREGNQQPIRPCRICLLYAYDGAQQQPQRKQRLNGRAVAAYDSVGQ